MTTGIYLPAWLALLLAPLALVVLIPVGVAYAVYAAIREIARLARGR